MIPNLTTEQRRENLEKAKAARQRRAVSESRRLRGLGANQRAALVELFGGAQ